MGGHPERAFGGALVARESIKFVPVAVWVAGGFWVWSMTTLTLRAGLIT